MSNFFIQQDEKEKGPFTIDQLAELWKSGEVNSETPHRDADDFEWKPLGIRKSIFEQTGYPSAAMPKLRLCKKCGARILDKALSCHRCGAKTSRGKTDPIIWSVIAIVIVLVFLKGCH